MLSLLKLILGSIFVSFSGRMVYGDDSSQGHPGLVILTIPCLNFLIFKRTKAWWPLALKFRVPVILVSSSKKEIVYAKSLMIETL